MQLQNGAASSANGASTPHDLFVLTDEQILEIEPEQEASGPAVEQPLLAVPARRADTTNAQSAAEPNGSAASSQLIENTQQSTQAGVPALLDPPAWLAAQMKDPWSGEEARELWNGVQQAQQEAAAYRTAFATPEDARALKELYPGGVNEARAAANRARLLDDIDRAYFGTQGTTPEQTSAARAQLAAMMLREDPAAFREMVFAGLRAIEEAEKGISASAGASNLPRLAQVFNSSGTGSNVESRLGLGASSPAETAAQHGDASLQAGISAGAVSSPLAANAASGATGSAAAPAGTSSVVGAQHAASLPGTATTSEAHVASYAAFEKAANEDLERSVGAAITRTIEQALPNLKGSNRGEGEGARHGVPLPERLGAAVRQDVEAALKGDRQLGEQIAQILSARRFDNETRAQVVRLIDDRARQLVPSAARRVINDWTQATLAAHRGNASRSDAVSVRREVALVTAQGPLQRRLPAAQAGVSSTAFSSQAAQTRPGADPHRNASRSDAQRLDYRKLSDEQI